MRSTTQLQADSTARKKKPKPADDRQLSIQTLWLSERTVRLLQSVADDCNSTLSEVAENVLSEALLPFDD